MQSSIQRIGAVSRLTIKAAFRFKLIPWLLLTMGLTITTIPYLIRHNGTAEMFAQVQLSYSLMTSGILLAASTLWLSCGILGQDLEKHHITLLASKPIARWEIWIGRWLGICSLNTFLMIMVGLSIYALLLFHARDLSQDEQSQLKKVVLISRASASEKAPDEEREINALFEKRKDQLHGIKIDTAAVRERLAEEVRWMNQLVKPLHRRLWSIHIGNQVRQMEDETLQLRVKFYASPGAETTSFPMTWIVGDPSLPTRWERELDLAPMTTHEWSVPANLIDPDGNLRVECRNYTDMSLVFRVEDGLIILFPDGGFGLNYIKGLVVLLCWLSLLTAVGLWAATFASLPVATFLIMTLLLVAGSENLFKSIAIDGTISTLNEETGKGHWHYLDWLLVPLFTFLYKAVETIRSIAPIESLVTGRSIPTYNWLLHLSLVIGLMIAPIGAWGMFLLTQKELDQS